MCKTKYCIITNNNDKITLEDIGGHCRNFWNAKKQIEDIKKRGNLSSKKFLSLRSKNLLAIPCNIKALTFVTMLVP